MTRRRLLALLAAGATATASLAVGPPTPVAAAGGGSITIVVDTAPADGTDVGFTSCLGAGCGTFTLDDDTDPTLPDRITGTDLAPGTYTVTQDADTPALTSLTCTDGGTVDLAARRATIVLAADADVTCRFKTWAPWIEVVHDTSPDGPPSFVYRGCLGDDCDLFTLDDDPSTPVPRSARADRVAFGTYTITALPDPRWTVTNIICAGRAQLDVPGQRATIEIDEPTDNVSCRFTVETQRITVRVNDLADSGADHHFTSCRGSEGCGVFFIDDDAGADATVPDHIASGPIPAGTYTISLEPDPGRELVSIVCTAGTVDLPALRATVTIAPSQHPVCTFTTRPR
ncbi:MAG: hypothetical protein H6518_09130 [Microthrixaceae bacterium]|nr:hypothetical protein [Microthrixaceae bacterium]